MKILQVSMSDSGGAGIAAVRLHLALLERGVDSKLLTLQKHNEGIKEHYVFDKIDTSAFPPFTLAMKFVDRVLKRFKLKSDYYRSRRKRYTGGGVQNSEMINFSFSEYRLENHPLVREADIIHLHWVCGGFLDFQRFFKGVTKHVVWTLHDMNPFTGGCHYAYECLGYLKDCHACPQLEKSGDPSVAEDMLSQKVNVLGGQERSLSIVTPSKWLMDCSKKSKLFSKYEHRHIYNIVNEKSFCLTDKASSREKLSLPTDKKIILCIGSLEYPRKGNDILVESLPLLNREDVILCCVGSVSETHKDNPSIVQLGYVKDSNKMRDIYNAADIFVLPTRADNFPNTIVESLLTGTPVASFYVGGVPEQINESNGILIEKRDPQSVATSLDQFFDNKGAYKRGVISEQASRRYASEGTVNKHIELYGSLCAEH